MKTCQKRWGGIRRTRDKGEVEQESQERPLGLKTDSNMWQSGAENKKGESTAEQSRARHRVFPVLRSRRDEQQVLFLSWAAVVSTEIRVSSENLEKWAADSERMGDYLDMAIFCYGVVFDLLHMFFYRLQNTTPPQTQNTCIKQTIKRMKNFKLQ